MKLTAKSATTLSLDGAKDRAWFDEDISGFGIRLREGGSSTWIFRYRAGNRQRSITLGNTAAVPFALARKNAASSRPRFASAAIRRWTSAPPDKSKKTRSPR